MVAFSNMRAGDQAAWAVNASLVAFDRSTKDNLTIVASFATNGAALRPVFLQGQSVAPFNSYMEVSAEL